MYVGVIQAELLIEGARTLKEKRMVLRSMKDRIRRHFNVSVAEVGDNDLWDRSIVAIALVANDHRFVESCCDRILNFVERSPGVSVLDSQTEIL